MGEKDGLGMIAKILVIIGGLNWGLVGIANLDLVKAIFGSVPVVAQLVYILVGLSALYMVLGLFKN